MKQAKNPEEGLALTQEVVKVKGLAMKATHYTSQ